MSDVASAIVWPGLTSLITSALLAISALNVTNGLAKSLYDKDAGHGGDLEFTYDSNAAQKLRILLANFPRCLLPTYVVFVLVEIAYALLVISISRESDDAGNSQLDWYYGGIPLLAVFFTLLLVVWTAILNSRYYSVMNETQQGVGGREVD